MSGNKIRAVHPLGFPWKTQDPFLFCAYHLDAYPEGNADLGPAEGVQGRAIGQDFTVKDGWRMYHGSTVPGFPYHPHRGFETITINKQGFVDHSDSLGSAGRFGAGDVQWMTAGSGVQHSEMFPLLDGDGPNTLEIFQIWLNLPADKKLVDPHFKMLWREDIPRILHQQDKGEVRIDLIAGRLEGQEAIAPPPESWAADNEHGITVLTVELDEGTEWTLPSSEPSHSTSIFYYKGNTLNVNGQQLSAGVVIETDSDGPVQFKATEGVSKLLIIRGKPIAEPVVQYGPFVMNSEAGIMQAFEDFRRTEFGGWPWPEKEQTHGAAPSRFALHADGSREEKPV